MNRFIRMTSIIGLGLVSVIANANHALDQIKQIEAKHSINGKAHHQVRQSNRQKGSKDSRGIAALQKDYRFVLFYMSTCPHCQRFDPILKAFSGRYGIGVTAYTVDGRSLPSFPHSVKPSQKVLTSFFANPSNTVVPALFVINVHNLHAYPVNYGEMSYQGLVVRMKKLSHEIISQEQKGERA